MCENNFGTGADAKENSKQGLALLLFLYLVLGMTFGVVVPLWEAPDEVRHFAYAKYLIDNFSLPPLSHIFEENPVTLAFHPPLYHALISSLAYGYPEQDPQRDIQPAGGDGRRSYIYEVDGVRFPYRGIPLRAHLMRVVSLLLGIGVIVCAWCIAAEIFPAERQLAFTAAAIVALNPQFIFINGSVNDQALSNPLGSVVLLMLARVISAGLTPALSIVLGLAFGAALLTTTSAVLFVPVILAAVLASGAGPKKASICLALIFAIAVVVAGGWYLRNEFLWHDPFLLKLHREVFGKPFLRESNMSTIEFINLLRLLHRSFWGVFGSMNVPLPTLIYWMLECFTGLCVVGFLRAMRKWRERFSPRQLGVILVFLLAVVLFFCSIVQYNFTFISAQGRYLFIVLPAVGILGAVGLTEGIGLKPVFVAAAVFVGLLALDFAALVFSVWPAYH